jgi:hypothetical protein
MQQGGAPYLTRSPRRRAGIDGRWERGRGGGRHACDMLCVLAVHGLVDYSALIVERMEVLVAKAYWVVTYRTIKNQDAFAAYAQLAVPAVQEGGRTLHRPRQSNEDV